MRKMLRHHENQLDIFLDRLYLYGTATLSYAELYLVFNIDRLTKSVYREIVERWEERCTETYEEKLAPKLSVLEGTSNAIFTLIREPLNNGEKWVSLDERT
jgi:hypothetical protein